MRNLVWTAAFGPVTAVVLMAGCNVPQSPVAPANVSGASQPVRAAFRPPTGNRPAEVFNQILPFPHACQYSTGPCPTDFEVVFKGDVTADIPPNEPLNVHENAFCNPSPPSPNCAPTVTFNSSNDTTTLEWSGPILYHNRVSGRPGVHFGVGAAKNFSSIKSLEAASYWTYSSSPQTPMPIISIDTKQPASSKNWKYAIVYVAGSTTKGSSNEYASWNEIAYVAKSGPNNSTFQPRLMFANYGSQTIYVSSSGIVLNQPVPSDPECLKTPVCKENLALLADLQEVNYPPPGQSGSPFIALAHPPPAILKPRK